MKIGFLINSLGLGGAEHVVVSLMEDFHKKGHDIFLVTSFQAGEEYPLSFSPRRYLVNEEMQGAGGLWKMLGPIGRIPLRLKVLEDIWTREQPEAVYAFIGKLNIYGAASLKRINRRRRARGREIVKLILSVRSDPAREYPTAIDRLLADRLFPSSHRIVFQTQAAMEAFNTSIRRRGVILPNALDESFLRPPYQGPRRPEIVMVGRLDANKNHALTIRALHSIADDFPGLYLTIYGDALPGDDSRERLLELIEELGLGERVRLMGRQGQIRDRIEAAAVFVLASNFEGMPNALLEAMAAGLPVISTDCPIGGPAAVIKDGVNGYLIPVAGEKELSDRLRTLLSDETLAEKMGKEASKLAVDLSPERVCSLWEALLEEA